MLTIAEAESTFLTQLVVGPSLNVLMSDGSDCP